MSDVQETRFSDLVKKRLSPDQDKARSLWTRLAMDYERGGPNAVRDYLATEQQRLEERIQTLLDQVEDEFNG